MKGIITVKKSTYSTRRANRARADLPDAAWSLRFAAHPKNLATAMTGFTRFAHLKEDISIFNEKTYRPMTASEHAAYAEAIKIEVGNGAGVPLKRNSTRANVSFVPLKLPNGIR